MIGPLVGKRLEKAILSVLNQTYSNVELVISDGGSFDARLVITKRIFVIDYWGRVNNFKLQIYTSLCVATMILPFSIFFVNYCNLEVEAIVIVRIIFLVFFLHLDLFKRITYC